MSDPTFDNLAVITATQNEVKDPFPYVISNGVQLYIGQLVKLTSGYLVKHAPTAAANPCEGVVIGPGKPGDDPNIDGNTVNANGRLNALAPGNTGGATGTAPKAVVERGSFVIDNLALTLANGTLAGTIADVGKNVYAKSASSNLADLTDTITSSDHPIGRIVGFVSATATIATYNVRIFSLEERMGVA